MCHRNGISAKSKTQNGRNGRLHYLNYRVYQSNKLYIHRHLLGWLWENLTRFHDFSISRLPQSRSNQGRISLNCVFSFVAIRSRGGKMTHFSNHSNDSTGANAWILLVECQAQKRFISSTTPTHRPILFTLQSFAGQIPSKTKCFSDFRWPNKAQALQFIDRILLANPHLELFAGHKLKKIVF